MRKNKQVTLRQARLVGDCLYLDWEQVDLEKFRRGLMGTQRRTGTDGEAGYPEVLRAGKTVLAHMEQFPDYFVRLARIRAEARVKAGREKQGPPRQSA